MSDLLERIAESMDAEPDLVAHLSELFRDVDDLAVRATDVVHVLESARFHGPARVLDLGCGKGAACLAMARAFGVRTRGVDALPEFIEHATKRARAESLEGRCVFDVGDVRAVVATARDYDLVLMLGLGAVLGDTAGTVAALRRSVRPGGLILLDDAYLAERGATDDGADLHDSEGLLRRLESHGDQLIAELCVDTVENERYCRGATARVRARAEGLAERHPALRNALLEFADRQRLETATLRDSVVGALFVVRVGGGY
jgi:SAM-dependent methyltransferase